MHLDITERKLAEQALRESEEKYRGLVETSQGLIWKHDLEGRFTYLNPAWEGLLGYQADEMLGRSFIEFKPPEKAELDLKTFETILQGEDVMGYESVYLTKSGEIRNLLVNGKSLRDASGTVVGTQGTAHDITARKQAETELRTLTEYLDTIILNLPVGLAIMEGPDFRYFRINHMLADINGLSIEDHLGRPIGEVLPDAAPEILPGLDEVLQTGRPSLPREFSTRLPKDPQEVRHFIDSFFPIFGEDGKPRAVGAVVVDITGRKQAEATLEIANTELAQAALDAEELALVADAANRAKSVFLANTSHELRTPLTGIIGLLQILNEGLADTPEEEREFIQAALDSSNHLLGVVNDVLDITNVEAGGLDIHLKRMRLADVLDKVQQAVSIQAQQKGLALRFDSVLDLNVQSDPARLRQVLLNLVGNAIKFTETGKVSVSVQPAADPDYVLIEVTDTGVGIAPKFLPSAFDKFSQADESLSRKHGGTGLGLAITRVLIEMMGGQVGLESEGVGRGTRAWLTLPLAEDI